MEFTGERYIPEKSNADIAYEHWHRYVYARNFTRGKDVLDIASGAGYGSSLLAQTARSVVGVDIDPEAVNYCQSIYVRPNLKFLRGSAEKVPIREDACFDVIVSFETLEHLGEAAQAKFLDEVRRLLRPGGLFVVSTPDAVVYNSRYAGGTKNEFHLHEFTKAQALEFLGKRFRQVKVMGQGNLFGSYIHSIDGAEKPCQTTGIEWTRNGVVPVDEPPQSVYMLAVCSDGEVPELPASVLVDGAGMILEEVRHSEATRRIALERQVTEAAETERKLKDAESRIEVAVREANRLAREKDALGRAGEMTREFRSDVQAVRRDTLAAVGDVRAANDRLYVFLRDQFQHVYDRLADLNAADKLRSRVAELEGRTRDLEAQRNVNGLLQSRLNEIVGSEWYRLCSKIERVQLFAFPKGSLRRESVKRVYYFVKRLYKRIRHPYEYMQAERAVRNLSIRERAQKLKRFDPLKLPRCDKPIVSVVIPVYNQFAYTYCCVESIIRNSGSVPYEVVLADDCSTDETRKAGEILRGVRIVRTERNLRFLLNCNNAAKQTRGRYILFLNNDTEVHEGWLKPLVDLCERDEKIGVTGSKLVYADGVLQEAGGILWSDGSAWNYGHGKDPNDFEYCYVKECDYISGAALMVRKALWDEIGGFDTRFAPAYYEDTDLCFEARKHGYKVVLQPQSVVTHFEGRSNGTDLSAGLKKYQVENQKKFYQKWKDTLAHHFPNGVNVFTARDRSAGKKHIFLVDHYIPTYDKDAGGRQIYFYLKTLQGMGFQVHLLGDNCMHDEPYTSTFQQMGIEVLYGERMYPQNREAWFRENGKHIDFAFLHRPHIAVNYLSLVRAMTKAKVIFFGADVGQIRIAREYEISRDPALRVELDAVTKQEDFLYGGADVNLCVGSGDADFVAKRYPGKPVFNIPLFIYDTFRESAPGFSERRDILFVGGFRHKPNVDGVLWFLKEIFPRVKRECPDMRFHIVGNEVPPSIAEIASDDVIVEGFLPDERLRALYDECRLTVAPLRFGAGVKGKIVDAMYFRSVVVTTTIGAEGIPQAPSPFAIADTAEDFARAVIRLYTDEVEWRKYQKDSLVVVKATYSLEKTQALLSRIFS